MAANEVSYVSSFIHPGFVRPLITWQQTMYPSLEQIYRFCIYVL